jgi:acetyl esterase
MHPRALAGVLLAALVPGVAGRATAATVREELGPEVTAEVYKHASGDDLWIYRFDPPGHDPARDRRPAVVFFFGGGWNGGTVKQFQQHARYLAGRGMVAFLADYRVKSRQGTQPDACVADGKSAVRWIRSHAEALGIDPQRIAAGGGSAGGHVAAAAGICDGLDDPNDPHADISSKPDALLLFNPVYDNGPDGYGHDRVKPWFPAISPAHNLSADDPPTIVFLGTRDPLIPVKTAERFAATMKAAGVRSELCLYPDQPHGFFNESKSPESFLDTVERTDACLVSLGWLTGPADTPLLESLLTAPRTKVRQPAR